MADDPKDQPKAEPKTKKVRVLTETRHKGKVLAHGSVVEMTNEEVKAQGGAVDPHPDAVAAAEKLLPKPEADEE
jgi:hypothetical protein